ncbi:sensor histidine kinase [Lactiplantibacillus argentoratensis]|uniref:sensor histidine kinase n=1 Tax=Lactiplantibacillus argentoratensis TaxID=271881 RepID=UPI003EB84157
MLIWVQYLVIGVSSFILFKKVRPDDLRSRQLVLIVILSAVLAFVFPFAGIFTTLIYWILLTFLSAWLISSAWIALTIVSAVEMFSIVADYIVGLLVDKPLSALGAEFALYLHVGVSAIITLLLTIFSMIALKRFFNIQRIDNTLLHLITILISFSFLVMYIDITYQRFLGDPDSLEQLNALFFIIYMVTLSIIIVVLFILTKRNLENKMRQKQMEDMQNYVDQLEQDYQDLRKFRHDYQNILISIENYINEEDIVGLENYYSKYIKKTQKQLKTNLFNLTELVNLKDKVAKSIISSKLTSAQSQGIESTFEEKDIVENFDIGPIEFVRILGILLDNSIEASRDSDKKVLRVAVAKEKATNIIFIGNSYSGSLPPLYKLRQPGFSTKGKNRGLGLSNVSSLIKEIPNVTLETRIDNDMFVQILRIGKGVEKTND